MRVAQRPSSRASERGLTLLEVLVSIGILALVVTLVYGAFDGMQRTRVGIERIDDRYHQGRQALSRMNLELQSAFLSLHQPQLLTASTRTTMFVGTDQGVQDRIDFTSFSHKRLMRNVHESDQNELSYFMGRDPDHADKYDLLRREQKEIDLDPQHGGVVNVLCEDVTVFDVQYLDNTTDTWLDAWDSSQAEPVPARAAAVPGAHPPRPQGRRGRSPHQARDEGAHRHAEVAHVRDPQSAVVDDVDRERQMRPVRAVRRVRRRGRVDERGVALILVLGAITVLTVFLTQLQEETSSELAGALAERDALKAEYFARSAVNLTRLLIATEPTISKSVAPIFALMGQKGVPQIPVWEFTDLVLGPFNDASGTSSFLSTIGGDPTTAKNIGIVGGGRFELTIVDEDAKINLNLAAENLPEPRERLAQQLLGVMAPQEDNPLFEGRDADGQFSDRQTICGALVDWADSESNGNEIQYNCDPQSQTASSHGPEDNFYQTLGLPYLRKNAAYDSLEEVRLVRGISDDFWATFVDPEPDNPKKRVMTVWGQGLININSANAQTLLALVCGQQFTVPPDLCIDPLQMQSFIMGVTLGKSLTMGLPLFGTKQMFIDMMAGKGPLGTVLTTLQVKPVVFKDVKTVKNAIGLHSHRFSVYADGIVPGYKRTTKVRIHAVLDFSHAGSLGPLGAVVIGGGQAAASAAAAAAATPANGANGATPGSSSSSSSSGSSTPAPGSPEAILAQYSANPAGEFIYWRIE